jgi:hypothetical protein
MKQLEIGHEERTCLSVFAVNGHEIAQSREATTARARLLDDHTSAPGVLTPVLEDANSVSVIERHLDFLTNRRGERTHSIEGRGMLWRDGGKIMAP